MDIEEEYDKIFRFCYWKVRNKETAEDLTQETFLRFLNSGYSEQGKRIRYLYTIARNLCIDESRMAGTEEFTEDVSDIAGETEDALAQIYAGQLLSRLSEDDRVLAIMRYINRESMTDISAVTGLSRFALYRKLKEIKKALRMTAKDNV